MRTRTLLVPVLLTLASAAIAHAQTATAPDAPSPVAAPADSVAPPHAAVRSSIDEPAAVHRDSRLAMAPIASTSSKGLGQARALMFVGAGAFVAGAIIGGDAGTLIMVGGAVVGLYGLYEYLK